MAGKVLIIGAGDAGQRIARNLALRERVESVTLAGLTQGRGARLAALIDASGAVPTTFVPLDGTNQGDVEDLLRTERPDVIVNSASLLPPLGAMGRRDQVFDALQMAGLGITLSAQLPIIFTVMRAVKEVGTGAPVANLSFPDVTNEILDKAGLAPHIGLGNVTIQWLKVRAELRRRGHGASLVRLIAHHNHVMKVMGCEPPTDPAHWPRIYLGDNGERDDKLAFAGTALTRAVLPSGTSFNELTSASATHVVEALLPEAPPARLSAPAPQGLPGGWPVTIANGAVELDLPPAVTVDEASVFLRQIAHGDGIEKVEDDGTVVFTDAARDAVAKIDPTLAEPLHYADADKRFLQLNALLCR